MNLSQQIFLLSAVTLAIVVYGVFKLFQRRKKSRQSVERQPKMRPKATQATPTIPTMEIAAVATPDDPTSQIASGPPELPTTAEAPLPAREPQTSLKSAVFVNHPLSSTETQTSRSFEEVEEDYPYFDQSDYAFGSITSSIAALMPTTDEGREKLTRSLRNAGYYSPHAWHNLTAIRYLMMVGPIMVFGLLLVVVPPQLETYVIISMVVTTILGWALPALYVRSQAAERLREISNAMPDMLDLLNMCVSQGMTVTSALGRVGRDIEPVYPALAKEMKIVTEQASIGSLSQSLTNLSQRVDLPEVHSFSSLLVQTERMGTSASVALSEYSDNMREGMKQRSDEKANSATFKLLFPTVLCLMPAVYLFLLGPAIVELNRFYEDGGADVLSTEIPDEYTGG